MNPVDGQAHDGSSDHSQIQSGMAVADAAAVFTGNDVQPLVQTIFDAPVVTIRTEHLLGVHLRHWARGQEKLYFGIFDWFAGNLDAARELSGLFGEGKVDAAGADFKGREAALFDAASVDLRALGAGQCLLRGKKRAIDLSRAVARSSELRADCL